jgi:hypothetical protein
MNSASTSIGSELDPKVGNVPLNNAAGTRNGSAINRFTSAGRANSCVLHGQTGATEGGPASLTYDLKLQDSADGSTGWADISGASLTQIVAASTAGKKNVNLSAAKQYIRAVEVITLTGGSTPKLNASSTVVLGGFDVPLPVA